MKETCLEKLHLKFGVYSFYGSIHMDMRRKKKDQHMYLLHQLTSPPLVQ